jgi:hypothetical protein
VKTRILTAVVTAVLAAAGLTGCAMSVESGQQVAYDVFTEVVALQKENPVDLPDLEYKVPAGVVLYAAGDDFAEAGEDADPRYVVAVVNLADGVVFAEQYPRGQGAQRFASLEAYADWHGQEPALSLPDIPSLAAAYTDNVDRAQRLFYAQHGVFAEADELVAWSTSTDNLAPDLSLPDDYRLAVAADATGYLTLATSPLEERAVVALGYCDSTPGHFVDDLGSLTDGYAAADDIMLGCLVPAGDGTYRADPLDYVTTDAAERDDEGRVLAVELPQL